MCSLSLYYVYYIIFWPVMPGDVAMMGGRGVAVAACTRINLGCRFRLVSRVVVSVIQVLQALLAC